MPVHGIPIADPREPDRPPPSAWRAGLTIDLWPKLTALCDQAIQSRLGGTIDQPAGG